ncbi:MAG: EF-P lysine aminoacylase GenX [Magnetococcales bacterium]|nr:EF-P lysine aminoacylase GenX [Magnetococcales bacterium]MBF0149653.1 EF-P lysine aminoacylase GenX [Magnetococcales bacterium]MBF0172499.1 EF-P lysine aminoacylase GenX [Magnetococcales bacterium]MBF0631796.1 EF-P lysine aminoacylase GenX [Magnetococcales bacterium]
MSNAPRAEHHPLWYPSASLETLQLRADMIHRIRNFFARRVVLEVTTPVWLPAAAPERHQTPPRCAGGYLQTSPETCMKRLVAAGSGPIYQIGPAFRAGESGRLHHPEFTMLEWYRPHWTLEQLMEEVIELIRTLMTVPSVTVMTFQEAWVRWVGVDPFLSPLEALVTPTPALVEWTESDRPLLVDRMFVERLEPALAQLDTLLILTGFPPWEPGMAELDAGPPPVARRFEVLLRGVELANGYQELRDPIEQRQRFIDANHHRGEDGKDPLPIDETFLQALQDGFPPCAGVALGLDRLLMLAFDKATLGEVMAFQAHVADHGC